jgi:glyoxylase-like metal-dependent hydrolase (beta-lactamase superfamily II)
MVEVIAGLWTVRISDADGLDTEIYILECDEGLILVDVGFTPKCHENIQAELSEMDALWEDIKMIIITHAHGDHIENLKIVKDLTHADVLIGEGDNIRLKERTGIDPDVILKHGDLIALCGGIEVIHVPGHSDGNLSLFLNKYKAIIAGDTVFGDRDVYRHIYPPPAKYCTDVELATKNLEILLDYDFDKLLMTHGMNILENAKTDVEKLVRKTRK